ncbi:MAG: hypothetical protein KAH56_00050 [Candidatus Krumholzibacteria bacterium]|nr:hypothetical protein [Candidatus Krumholzibacteria bacterium]
MKMLVVILALSVVGLGNVDVFAQEAHGKSMEELSKEIANPLAQIWNLSFQHNRTTLSGDSLDGDERINTSLFQPVLPIPMGDKYTFFARPVFTLVNGPSSGDISGGSPINPIGHGTDRTTQLGDTILPIGMGIAKQLGWSYGGGVTLIFPTSQNDLLGSHQYQFGPTVLALWANDDWLIGGHLQQWWGIGNDGGSDDDPLIKAAHDKNLNHMDTQYFIIRHLPNAWQLRASPHIRVDWEADSGNNLTLPIALGIGKMLKIGPMPVMLMAEYQYSVISPDNIGSDSTIMLQANFIIKNPFGSL